MEVSENGGLKMAKKEKKKESEDTASEIQKKKNEQRKLDGPSEMDVNFFLRSAGGQSRDRLVDPCVIRRHFSSSSSSSSSSSPHHAVKPKKEVDWQLMDLIRPSVSRVPLSGRH